MRVEILMIGSIGERPYRTLIDQYSQRCRGRLPITITACRDDRSMAQRAARAAHVVALDEHARCLDSMAFSRWLQQLVNSGTANVTFCLGGAAGLSTSVKAVAQEQLSLSPLTLNHQLALLVLVEQLYRGISILFSEPYHKA